MRTRNTILLFFAAVLLSWGCKQSSADDAAADPPPSGETNPNAYEEEVNLYESADRVIWQKPDLVVDQLGDIDGKVVADLGAGTGYFSRRIAYKGAKVIAIDIDPKAIRWMEEQKSRFPVELRDRLIIRMAEADDPKLETDEVDIVLLVNTYSYIRDRVNYFTRLRNAIRQGGSVVIIDFKKKETRFGPSLDERIGHEEIIDELEKAGYRITSVDQHSLEYQYIIKADEAQLEHR